MDRPQIKFPSRDPKRSVAATDRLTMATGETGLGHDSMDRIPNQKTFGLNSSMPSYSFAPSNNDLAVRL